ncbi:TPR repeat region [Dictyocaulus viviparus]|uniref:Succinate dehydrogenase assembly factor 2, mitochondrial n=1 Tax=Dictyocaulus viviparus TaxID=29172 RepID=A0A0D8Y806_DICVI|nr:TPR repeat region [Dictyocaulus viviparus]
MICSYTWRGLYTNCTRFIPLVFRSYLSTPVASEVAINEKLDAMRSRLLYQSKKRGILENDIILGEFAKKYLPKMEREELDAYDKLVNGKHMEWDLYYFLCGKKEPPEDVADSNIFKMLRQFVEEKKFLQKFDDK